LLRQSEDGLVTYHFAHLADEGLGLVHAVFTRLGGASQGPFSSLNLGHTVGDDEESVGENHRRILAHVGLEVGQVVTPHQVHSNRVALVNGRDAGQVLERTDGLITATPGLGLLLRFADCQPILLYDPEHHALGLIHAGWRSVAQGITRRAAEAMAEAFGTRPQALLAGLGPAIGPCCYTVGHKVAAAMGYALPNWQEVMEPDGEDQWRLDLSAANLQQLVAAGVKKKQIEAANICTSCHKDEFFSHRGDGGRTGRFAAIAFLQPRHQPASASGPAAATAEPADTPGAVDSLHPPGFPGFGKSKEEGT
jgi:YfiH family protein